MVLWLYVILSISVTVKHLPEIILSPAPLGCRREPKCVYIVTMDIRVSEEGVDKRMKRSRALCVHTHKKSTAAVGRARRLCTRNLQLSHFLSYIQYISFLFSFFLFVVCLFVCFFQTDKTKKKQYRQSGYGWVGESREQREKELASLYPNQLWVEK
jgi:hypothetical protein